MNAKWIVSAAVLVIGAIVAVYTWTQTYEIRMCRSMNGAAHVPATIEETAPGIHVLQWVTPGGGLEVHGRRPLSAGDVEYTLTCDPTTQACSLDWSDDGVSTGRSGCIHPGAGTATDYF